MLKKHLPLNAANNAEKSNLIFLRCVALLIVLVLWLIFSSDGGGAVAATAAADDDALPNQLLKKVQIVLLQSSPLHYAPRTMQADRLVQLELVLSIV